MPELEVHQAGSGGGKANVNWGEEGRGETHKDELGLVRFTGTDWNQYWSLLPLILMVWGL